MSTEINHRGTLSFSFEGKTQDEIIAALQTEGVRFRTFECVNEGDYAPEDAAWNYMDIPHLKHVHKQVDGVLTLAADAVTASIFFQRLPLFRLPLCVLIFQSASNSITYYTSFSIYLVIIQTTWEKIGEIRTRVTTRYAVGWMGRLAALGFPLIKWLLERNYRILMSEDLPMRHQRGALRKRGYDFRMTGEVPSFLESRKIMHQNVVTPEQNVITPTDIPHWGEADVLFESLVDGGVRLLGDSNHIGLTIGRSGGAIHVYPRLCPHEGASLDDSVRNALHSPSANRDSCVVTCPWHGRKFRPILTITLPARPACYETPWHRFEVDASRLKITCKAIAGLMAESLRTSDWSEAAQPIEQSVQLGRSGEH